MLSLKLTNNLNNNITAFKASKEGELALGVLDDAIKKLIDDFVQLAPGADGLKRVRWSGEGPGFFEVYCPGIGYNIVSTVTDCEDVSYVTSPYVPACLRECHWPPNTDVSRRPQPALVRLGAVRCLICGVCCAVSCCAVSCSAIFSEQSPLTCSEREPLSGGRGRLEHPRRTRRDDHSGVARDSNAGTSSCC